MFFTSAITSPLGSFQEGSGVFMKLKVSPFAFILAGLASLLFDLLLKLAFLAPVCLWFGISGGKCNELADLCIHIEIDDMQISEDFQCITGHMIMQWLKKY